MRFTVIGTDAAGLAMEFTLDARCADEAEHIARARGVNVIKVQLNAGASAAAPVATIPTAPAPQSKPTTIAATTQKPTPKPAARTQAKRLNLGLVSLALALVALLFCWIPTVGLISLPLCIVGLVAGGAGLLAAVVSRGGSRMYPAQRRPGRLVAPTGGLVLSGLALAATVMIATGPKSDADAPPAPIRIATDDEPAAEPSRPARDKPLRIVVSGTDSDTPRDFAKESARKPQPTAPIDVDRSPRTLGSAELNIEACTFGQIPLMGEQGRSAGITSQPMLLVRVSVRNAGQAPFTYSTMAGDESGLAEAVSLRDEHGVVLRRAKFGFGIVPSGRVASESVEPGRGLTDVLAFERPATPPRGLNLVVPGRCVGTTGEVTLPVPVPTIR